MSWPFTTATCRKGSRASKARLIRAAGLRWPAKEGFEFGKDQFGLDESQVRLYTAIARHTVLTCAALAICAVTAALLRDQTDTQAPPPTRPDQLPPADPASSRSPSRKSGGCRRRDRTVMATGTRGPMGHLDPPPPGPLPLVPQTRKTRPQHRDLPGQLTKYGCRTGR